MENVITFTRYWYLIKRTTNSAGIRANWINCVLYKVLLNLHIFPVLNIYCTEPYLGPVQRSYVYLYWQSHGPLIPIKIIVQFFECKILTWDQALFSFRFVNNIPAGMAKRKESLIQTFYETSAAHFLDWLAFAESANQNYFVACFSEYANF